MMITDRAALFFACLAQPDEDTPRLAYADCIEEEAQANPVRVKCPRCKGSGEVTYDMPAISETRVCGACDGTGEVTDTADAILASLIRLQIELGVWSGVGPGHPRERDILDRRPKWHRDLRMPCPGCGERIERAVARAIAAAPSVPVGITGTPPCDTCGGTGDLLEKMIADRITQRRTVTLHRGLTLRVDVRLDEVMREVECPECHGRRLVGGTRPTGPGAQGTIMRDCPTCDAAGSVWNPTPWATAFYRESVAMRRVPEVVPADAMTHRDYGGGDERPALHRGRFPPEVWRAICDGDPAAGSYTFREFATRGAALAVATPAVNGWLRGRVAAAGSPGGTPS